MAERITNPDEIVAELAARVKRGNGKAIAEAAGVSVGGLHELCNGRKGDKSPSVSQWRLAVAARVADQVGARLVLVLDGEKRSADVPGQERLFANPKRKAKKAPKARKAAK